jgi:hypothetical protein
MLPFGKEEYLSIELARQRNDAERVRLKMTKGIRTIYKTLHRKLNIEPHELHFEQYFSYIMTASYICG